MKSFIDYLEETEGSTNIAGPAVAGKDVPIGTDKRKKPKPLDGDAKVDVIDESNNEDESFMQPQFQYSESKWAGYVQYTIPHADYESLKYGRVKGSEWNSFIAHPDFQDKVRKVLYSKGCCVISSDQTGASVILRHQKVQRMKANDEFTAGD